MDDLEHSTAADQKHQRSNPALGDGKLHDLLLGSRLALFLCVGFGELGISSPLLWGLESLTKLVWTGKVGISGGLYIRRSGYEPWSRRHTMVEE